MNKSIAVIQLPLPKELINIICSFTFRSIKQVTRRNKRWFANVIRDLGSTDRNCYSGYLGSMYRLYYIVHITNPNIYGMREINKRVRMCINCGEFIKILEYSKCKCPKPDT
jgi:hypothetical protein